MFHRSRVAFILATTLALGAGLAGCANKPQVPDGVRFVTGGKLDEKVYIERLNLGFTPTGTARAWARMENRSGEKLHIFARVVFLGENQQKLESEPAWRSVFFEPKGVEVFEGTSMSAQVKEAVLEIKGSD